MKNALDTIKEEMRKKGYNFTIAEIEQLLLIGLKHAEPQQRLREGELDRLLAA